MDGRRKRVGYRSCGFLTYAATFVDETGQVQRAVRRVALEPFWRGEGAFRAQIGEELTVDLKWCRQDDGTWWHDCQPHLTTYRYSNPATERFIQSGISTEEYQRQLMGCRVRRDQLWKKLGR